MSELETLKNEIEALASFDLDLLRRRWRGLLGRPAPAHLSGNLLVRILAYRHQVARLGDIDRASRVALGEMIGDAKFRAGARRAERPPAKPRWRSGRGQCWSASMVGSFTGSL